MNTRGISAILLSWKRPQNVRAIVESLASCPDVKEIIVWNNNFDEPIKIDTEYTNLTILQSSRNFLCPARYSLPYLAKYETMMFNDDDLLVSPADIEKIYRHSQANKNIITGIKGRDIHDGRYSDKDVYGDCDIVLGQFMMFEKALLGSVYQNLLKLGPHVRGDDIAFSLFCGTRHFALKVPYTDLGMADEHALYRQPGHGNLRQQMVERIRSIQSAEMPPQGIGRRLMAKLGFGARAGRRSSAAPAP